MSRRLTGWLPHASLALAASVSLIGCGQSDQSGYRPAKEHSAEVKNADGRENKEPLGLVQEPVSGDIAAVVTDQNVTASALVPVNVVDGANVRALMSIPAIDPQAARSVINQSQPVAGAESISSDSPSAAKKIELLVKEKTFRNEAKTGSLRVSFDDFDLLKVLNMEPVVDDAVDYMPQWLTNLNGKTIKLRGYMFPTHDAEGIEQFVLARDNQICCFGRDPKIYDLVQITMKAGKTTNYIPSIRAFDVIGKFRIDMQSEGGKPYGLYFIDDAQVIDR